MFTLYLFIWQTLLFKVVYSSECSANNPIQKKEKRKKETVED